MRKIGRKRKTYDVDAEYRKDPLEYIGDGIAETIRDARRKAKDQNKKFFPKGILGW